MEDWTRRRFFGVAAASVAAGVAGAGSSSAEPGRRTGANTLIINPGDYGAVDGNGTFYPGRFKVWSATAAVSGWESGVHTIANLDDGSYWIDLGGGIGSSVIVIALVAGEITQIHPPESATVGGPGELVLTTAPVDIQVGHFSGAFPVYFLKGTPHLEGDLACELVPTRTYVLDNGSGVGASNIRFALDERGRVDPAQRLPTKALAVTRGGKSVRFRTKPTRLDYDGETYFVPGYGTYTGREKLHLIRGLIVTVIVNGQPDIIEIK